MLGNAQEEYPEGNKGSARITIYKDPLLKWVCIDNMDWGRNSNSEVVISYNKLTEELYSGIRFLVKHTPLDPSIIQDTLDVDKGFRTQKTLTTFFTFS